MKHVIITGGAGFIGSHLCERFLKLEYAVTAIDNLITGRKSNLANALQSPYFTFIEQDICQPIRESTVPFLATHGLDGIFHFACPASPTDFDRIPFEILAVDSIGTIQTIRLALQYQSRYVLASTSEVYGDPLVHPQKEDYWGNVNPIGPRACYDETKRFAEAYVSTAIRHKGLNGRISRIFNTYGPRMKLDDGRLVPELCRQLIRDQNLTIHGDGFQTRSFCFVSDLVDGIVRLYESGVQDPVNLGNPEEHTILTFSEILSELAGKTPTVKHLPKRPDDPRKRCPDITRATELLGWSPRVSLREGLQVTLDYFRTQL